MKNWQSTCWFGCFLLLISGCNPVVPSDAGNGLIYCSEGTPATLNPQLNTSSTVVDASSYQLFNRLLSFNTLTQQYQPELASSWQISEDGTRYRFRLRNNVQFHRNQQFEPTRPLNASDVVFSFQRILDPNNPYHGHSSRYPFFEGIGMSNKLKDVRALADDEVEFILYQPDATFLANLATNYAVILSQEYANFMLNIRARPQFDTQPIGTGPFKLSAFAADRFIRYQRHENYWGEPPTIDTLVFDITANSTMRLAKVITGECDVMGLPLASDLRLIREQSELKISLETGFNVGYFAFNTLKPPFNNVKVRQAISYAFNRGVIMEAVYYGTASPANSLLPPLSWAYDPSLPQYDFDLEYAQELLNEAGYENGFTFELWAMPLQRSYNPNAKKMALLIQDSLAELNIDVQIISHDWHSFRHELNQGAHDAVLIGWSADNSDPDNFLRPLLSCRGLNAKTNRTAWCNAEFDHLLDLALETHEQQERKQLYWQAQQIIRNESPLIPIAHGMHMQVKRSDIAGIGVMPFGGVDFAQAERH